MAKNNIASKSRVRRVIGKLEQAGANFVEWREDSPFDSPKIEVNYKGFDWIVAVEANQVAAMNLVDMQWTENVWSVAELIQLMDKVIG